MQQQFSLLLVILCCPRIILNLRHRRDLQFKNCYILNLSHRLKIGLKNFNLLNQLWRRWSHHQQELKTALQLSEQESLKFSDCLNRTLYNVLLRTSLSYSVGYPIAVVVQSVLLCMKFTYKQQRTRRKQFLELHNSLNHFNQIILKKIWRFKRKDSLKIL